MVSLSQNILLYGTHPFCNDAMIAESKTLDKGRLLYMLKFEKHKELLLVFPSVLLNVHEKYEH